MTKDFNFETNIEKRMPDTGKVFYVDRMTSDYALAHPFNVDKFIEEVFQKYERLANEYPQHFGSVVRSREQLRRLWNLVLQMPERGDKTLYPNQNGQQHALMEVWQKAGDYWRRGLRIGDTLPAIAPSCRITRLNDSEWIALFPKDIQLLENSSEIVAVEQEAESVVGVVLADDNLPKTLSEQNDATNDKNVKNTTENVKATHESVKATPIQMDLFAQMKMEMQALREENERLRCNMIQIERAAACSPCSGEETLEHTGDSPSVIQPTTSACSQQGQSPSVPTRRQRRERRREQDVMALHTSPAITVAHSDDDHSQRNMKIFAAVATAAVFLVLVNTVGLFGVAALGLLAGGLVK